MKITPFFITHSLSSPLSLLVVEPQRASMSYLFGSLKNNNKDGVIWEELMKMVGSELWRRFHKKMQNNFGE
ncbi:hypothetical protein MtrunA17_Chr4g0042301 [Medicago truncatula]|uniref:Uncharacterized protein n=1 Tax=Medicago truncatula TaxID=3880 RepID=A0A396IB35_MEDTR|nr:hypothetical protein MtrunA17_Chr4g0042301 [Medicago truncatula]